MKDKLEKALSEISDSYIADAANYKKKRRLAPWLGAVAAVLAVCICAGVLWRPIGGADPVATLSSPAVNTLTTGGSVNKGAHIKYAIASPIYPKVCAYPTEEELMRNGWDTWWDGQKALHNQPDGYADSLRDYFASSTALLLGSGSGENAACSPVNIYMALAMLAEVTDGESRGQLLKLLNADSIEALREQAGHVWKGHYNDDGLSTSILGASLWLDDDYTCVQRTADLLAENYFASIFHGDLGSEEMNEALRSWLSQQTGGLLDEYIGSIEMDERTALALASTIYYQARWQDEFYEGNNTEQAFHGTKGDTTEVFMHRQIPFGTYYWGEGFGAVPVALLDGSTMWLFLPDEGVTPETLMGNGQLFEFLYQDPQYSVNNYPNLKSLRVNLSIPKFDIASETDLTEQLQTLGVTDIFNYGTADFTPIVKEGNEVFVGKASHAARVAIDEEGVTAAAYTAFLAYGAGAPTDDEMDFVLDRPFAFVIESQDGLPLFAGIVNEP